MQKLTEQVYKHYQNKLVSRVSYIGRVHMPFEPLAAQSEAVQKSFKKAALSCSSFGARPKDWVEAQFAKFEEWGQYLDKNLTPQPFQMFGMNAAARYAQWKQERRDEARREKSKTKTVSNAFVLEERNLKTMVRSMRTSEIDVLCEKPDQFSVEFLKSKGVYKAVKAKRRELRGDL